MQHRQGKLVALQPEHAQRASRWTPPRLSPPGLRPLVRVRVRGRGRGRGRVRVRANPSPNPNPNLT